MNRVKAGGESTLPAPNLPCNLAYTDTLRPMWLSLVEIVAMELLEIPFTGPVLPATIAVGCAVLWSLLAIFGATSGEGGWFSDLGGSADTGIDLDLSPTSSSVLDGADGDSVLSQIGRVAPSGTRDIAKGWLAGMSIGALRWLNLGGVPLMIWGAIFAVAWWFVAGVLWIGVDRLIFEPNWIWSGVLTVKNLILAALLTKLITKPLRRSLTPDRITTQSLIGKECMISSTEATPEFGLVKFKTGGAPLLLNVRTDGPTLLKGTPVWIVHYDRQKKVYIVSPTSTRRVDPVAEKLVGESKQADF